MIKTKRYFIMAILLLMFPSIYGQRYLAGFRGIEARGGIVDGGNGYHLGVAWSVYNRKATHWVFGMEYLNRPLNDFSGKIPLSQFTGEGGYYMKIVSDRKKIFFLSLGMSALAGYETVNWGDRYLPDGGILKNRDGFIYGGALTLELETYLTDRLVLLLNIRERGLWGGTTDKFHNQVGLGLKYIID